MKKDNDAVSLQSIQFILQHPWLFLSALVIILSIVNISVSTSNLVYFCKGIVAVESSGAELIGEKLVEKRREILTNISVGPNIKAIVKQMWPEADEEADPVTFNSLVEKVRNPKTGIKMVSSDRFDDFITITFSDIDPNVCYQGVKATVDTMIAMSQKQTSERIETNVLFLQKQMEFYKSKINDIDKEVARIRTELRKKYPELSSEEKNLVDEMLGAGASAIKSETMAQQYVNYDVKITELKLQLLELQKVKELLKKKLELGISEPLSGTDIENDAVIMQYTQAIVTKEVALSDYLSRGYTTEHPFINKIKEEIDNLKRLKDTRVDELNMPNSSLSKIGENRIKAGIKNVESQTEIVKMKIKELERLRITSTEGFNPLDSQVGMISTQATRLTELSNEKIISQGYYNSIMKELEVAEIRQRLQKEEAGIKIKIIEAPVLPTQPVPMQREKKIVLGLVIALACGTGLAYLADSLDKSVKTASELRELIKVPVLASIDQINLPSDIKKDHLRRRGMAIFLLSFALLSKPLYNIVMSVLRHK